MRADLWARPGRLTRAQRAVLVLRYHDIPGFARGLRPVPQPGSPAPFAVATAPAGLSLHLMTASHLCLAPALTDQASGRGICLDVNPGTAEPEPRTGGRPR